MRLLHVTRKHSLDGILGEGLKLKPKRIRWRDVDGAILEDRIALPSECPPAIHAYPLQEDGQARYNCWVKDSKPPSAAPDTCGIVFEPPCWLCIGTWAFGSDFVTRKRPITWFDFREEACALAAVAGTLLGIERPTIYDVVWNYDLFTEENFERVIGDSHLPFHTKSLFKNQFCQLGQVYVPGFEVCAMEEDVPPSAILAWVDLAGVTDSEAWYDEALANRRIHRMRRA